MTDTRCICTPCTTPAMGVPSGHCAACCYGTMIEEYDLQCPVAEHRAWAHRQFGLAIPDDLRAVDAALKSPASRD